MKPVTPTWTVLGRASAADAGLIVAVDLDAAGRELTRRSLAGDRLADVIADSERGSGSRWVWSDAVAWYPGLLAAGVRVARCHDLRLCHAILRDAASVIDDAGLRSATAWNVAAVSGDVHPAQTLFDFDGVGGVGRVARAADGPPADIDEVLEEFARQRTALERSTDPGRLRLLLAAESAGALIAAELRAAGLPWDPRAHDALLEASLGPRPTGGAQPALVAESARRVRAALGDPSVSIDSQPKLLRALHRVGVLAESTNRWELARFEHPVIEPLLEYKKRARLLSANGWAWLEEWVHDGRFRPVYIPGGVVTGRWASSGGGALQLPRQLRPAVRADPGWTLVVADVAQLEPRVLAAMASDHALADAARGQDLYAGIVARGAVATRADAKLAMLGAMYGATSGESGRLVPALRRSFPRAMGLVDAAARVGEDGGIVSTWLGRSSPAPALEWAALQSRATEAEASGGDEARARRHARDRGRFTRNFVVQGTAAEWALAWLADLRGRLSAFPEVPADEGAPRSGAAFSRRPHLAFFLHDEVIVHAPHAHAAAVADAIRDAAEAAGRVLFGGFPIDFPLDVHVAETAQKD